jgi:NitT/TauT family transport system ATP-binding protein
VTQAIDEVGLAHARHLRPAQLSGGMAQRTALARCLARQPSVLLLADRIVLLGGTPGRILGVWQVDLPQPRADLLPEMGALRLEILTRLRAALRTSRGAAVPA